MKRGNVFFRVDGSAQIGLGHIVRCIALADMLKDDFDIHFFCKEIPENLEASVSNEGFGITRLMSEYDFFKVLNGEEIVVLDNYFFDSEYQKSIKSKGNRLIYIDDINDKEFYADLIINISPGIRKSAYQAQAYTNFALGLKYALLRPSFLLRSGKNKTNPDSNKTLICLGGSDTSNKTLDVLKRLKNTFETLSIVVVVGVSYPFLDELKNYISKLTVSNTIEVYHNVNELFLSQLMSECSLAICSPSTVSIEYLSVTKGLLFLLLTADNQEQWYNYALSKKLAYEFSENNIRKYRELKSDHSLQDKLLDGNQRKRFIKLLRQL